MSPKFETQQHTLNVQNTDRSRKGFARSAIDWLFGYDFFISYAHADGPEYATTLEQELSKTGFQVFLDSKDYQVGDDLSGETYRRVRMSKYLIVLVRPHALKSRWVQNEIEAFLTTGRAPIVIEFNDALSSHPPTKLSQIIKGSEWLRLSESLGATKKGPADKTLKKLERAFQSRRQDSKRVRTLIGVGVAGVIISVAAGFSFLTAELNLRSQEAQASVAFTARAENELNNRRFETGAYLALAATAPRRDGLTPRWQRQVLTNAASNYFATQVHVGDRVNGTVRSVAFSPDATALAIGTNTGHLWIYDLNEKTIVKELETKSQFVGTLVFSPDGRYLLSGGEGGIVKLWSWPKLVDQNPVFDIHKGTLATVAFSHDGAWFAVGTSDGSVRVLDPSTGKERFEFKNFRKTANQSRKKTINSLAFSPDDSLLAVATGNNTIALLDAKLGTLIREYDKFGAQKRIGGNWDQVLDLAFSINGKLVVTASYDGVVRRWNVHNGNELLPPFLSTGSSSLNGYAVNTLAFTPDGSHLALGTDNGDVLLRDFVSGYVKLRLFGHVLPVNDLSISENGMLLASASMDGTVWIWDLSITKESRLVNLFCDRLAQLGHNIQNKQVEIANKLTVNADDEIPEVCTKEHRMVDFEPIRAVKK